MVAAYENQPSQQVELDPNAPPPEVKPEVKPEQKPEGDKPADEQKPTDETPKPEAPKDLKALFETKAYAQEIAETGKLSDASVALFESVGIPREVIDRMVELEVANAKTVAAQHDAKLHTAAGGEAEFKDLVTWGKANLTAEQQTYFDEQLNGPFAAEAVALLKAKRGTPAPTEQALHVGGGGGGAAVSGYKSEAELIAAMSDPRYQTDPAYRQSVARQLAVSRY